MEDRGVACRRTRGLAALACIVVTLAPAWAFAQFDRVPDRPLRLIGYWDRGTNDPTVIGSIPVSGPNGGNARNFGVTSVQAYAPDEEGMQIFNPTNLQPVTLRAVGKDDVVKRFMQAPSTEKVTVFGRYVAGSGMFILGTVTVGEPAASPSPTP